MSTKKKISDAVLYKLAGGVPDAGFPVDERDIWAAIDNRVNSLFKLKHFETTLPSGETIPEAAMIATYENVAVSSTPDSKSKATLPITPIYLPKNVGIYLIYDPKNPDNPFVPLQRGTRALLNSDELLNDLLGQISYEPKGNVVIFSKDITLLGVSAVTMELCVMDVSEYGVTDELPIPADYFTQLEEELFKEFGGVTPENGIVNNHTNAGQKSQQ